MNKQTIQLMINKLHMQGYACLDRSKQEFIRYEDKDRFFVFDRYDSPELAMIAFLQNDDYVIIDTKEQDLSTALTANLSTQEVLDKLNLEPEEVLLWALSHPDPMPVVSEPEPEPKPMEVWGVEYKVYGDFEEFKVFRTKLEAMQFVDEFLAGCMDEDDLADMKAQGLDLREYAPNNDIASAYISRHEL